jgi:hypothetical protein
MVERTHTSLCGASVGEVIDCINVVSCVSHVCHFFKIFLSLCHAEVGPVQFQEVAVFFGASWSTFYWRALNKKYLAIMKSFKLSLLVIDR